MKPPLRMFQGHFLCILPVICSLALSGCLTGNSRAPSSAEKALASGDPSAPSQVTPSESLKIAKLYAEHAWRPFARNILHGNDPSGIRVDTPDFNYRPLDGRNGWWIPGEINQGIPYKWGGFDDPAAFSDAIDQGFAGGDVSSPAKRNADNAAVSFKAAGVDCSGFVSRCLKLPRPYDSSQLPSLCDPISDPLRLQPGDLLNIPKRHVMLCAGWAKPDRSWIYFYETGGVPEWKPALKLAPLDKLLALGYTPLHYKGMARELVPTGKEILTRDLQAKAVVIEEPQIGDP